MKKHGIQAQIVGEVIKEPVVRLVSQAYFNKGKLLQFTT